MSALTEAYREYLERMFDDSHELFCVDVFTVPQDVDVTSPTAQMGSAAEPPVLATNGRSSSCP